MPTLTHRALRLRLLLCAAAAVAVVSVTAGCGAGGTAHGSGAAGSATGSATGSFAKGSIAVTRALPIDAVSAGWPMLLHGPSHYGAATVIGPQTAHVRWRRTLTGAIVAGPVTGAHGLAYVASSAGVLHALRVSSGRDRWHFAGGGSYASNDLSTAPLVLGDGGVIWPGPQHRLFGLGPGGRLRWTLPGNADLLTPVLDPLTQTLVVADQSGEISGYRLGGGAAPPPLLWSRRLAGQSFGSPVVAADGTIYETAGKALFALTPAGHVRWMVRTPALIEVSPAIADHGIVVFGSDDLKEYGIDSMGHVRWRVPIGNFTYSSPLALSGHRVIFGNHSGQMTVLDSDSGHRLARDQGQGQLWTSSAVDGRGDAYFASRTGQIFGFGPTGGRLFDLNAGSTFDSYPALAADGTLLIGSDSGVLYGLR